MNCIEQKHFSPIPACPAIQPILMNNMTPDRVWGNFLSYIFQKLVIEIDFNKVFQYLTS